MLLRSLLLTLVFACSAFAQDNPEWTTPHAPFRMIGNVYYVGSKDLASYLITTPQGLILINSSLTSSVPLIRKNVEALGFQFSDVKILLISHAHWDHAAGSAEIKRLDRGEVHGDGCRCAGGGVGREGLIFSMATMRGASFQQQRWTACCMTATR